MAEQEPIENLQYNEVKARFEKAIQTEDAVKALGNGVKDDIEYLYSDTLVDSDREGCDLDVQVDATNEGGRISLKLKCYFIPRDESENYVGPIGDDYDGVEERDFFAEPGLSKNTLDKFKRFLEEYFSSSNFLELEEIEKLKELNIGIQDPKLFFKIIDVSLKAFTGELMAVQPEPSIQAEIDGENNTCFVDVYVTL